MEIIFFDIMDYSCLNGWSFGGLIANAHDHTMFLDDLFRNKAILSNATLDLMTADFESTTIYFPITYGLGIIPLSFAATDEDKDKDPTGEKRLVIGHPG